jgi:hypothetical protein
MLTAMVLPAAIGASTRFPSTKQLVGSSGVGARVLAVDAGHLNPIHGVASIRPALAHLPAQLHEQPRADFRPGSGLAQRSKHLLSV